VRAIDVFAVDKTITEYVILGVRDCERLEHRYVNEFDSAKSVYSGMKAFDLILTLALHSSSTCALRAPDHDNQETTSAQQSISPIPDHLREFLWPGSDFL
jgi:hypothetical protein